MLPILSFETSHYQGQQLTGRFIDVLESGYLYQEDYHTLFGKLGNMELALLFKLIFVEEIRVEASSLTSIQHQCIRMPIWSGKSNIAGLFKV